jgi:hypothetical protein
MLRLFGWLRGEGGKGKAGKGAMTPPPEKDRTKTARTATAAAVADKRWDKDGERADQDYYHVPGAGNPDRTDPPTLHGEELGRPEKTTAAKKPASKPRKRKPAKGQGGTAGTGNGGRAPA